MPAVTQVLDGHLVDVGGAPVRRLLPQIARRHVGPFVFFDEFIPLPDWHPPSAR